MMMVAAFAIESDCTRRPDSASKPAHTREEACAGLARDVVTKRLIDTRKHATSLDASVLLSGDDNDFGLVAVNDSA